MDQVSAADVKHRQEVSACYKRWKAKPLLQQVYGDFYQRIGRYCIADPHRPTVEVGSGFGAIKNFLPDCITSDFAKNNWTDRIENVYQLSFSDGSIANLLMLDVFHHLEFPGSALNECRRVLRKGGRLVLLEPAVSWLGILVYGLFHHEPLGLNAPTEWIRPPQSLVENDRYYANQSNAHRVFCGSRYRNLLTDWQIVSLIQTADFSYIASGGFQKLQLYPQWAYRFVKQLDRWLDRLPIVFATRMLIVLESQ